MTNIADMFGTKSDVATGASRLLSLISTHDCELAIELQYYAVIPRLHTLFAKPAS